MISLLLKNLQMNFEANFDAGNVWVTFFVNIKSIIIID